MKSKWQVVLTKTPVCNDFPAHYFPRNFYYQRDAQKLVDEVTRKGGHAAIAKKPTSRDATRPKNA